MKVLLTGRNGQVGFELEKALAALGQIVATDRTSLDIFYPDLIRRAVRQAKPDVIVNAAAYTAVDQAESEPDIAMEVNGVAPGILGEEAKRLGALLVHYSTDYVFDGAKDGPYVETDKANPLNVYGRTKLEGELRIAASRCRHLILRTSWVYGARGKNFLLTILRAAARNRELRIVDDQIGAPTNSADIAKMTVRAIESSLRHGLAGTFHMTALGHTSWCDFAREIVRSAGLQAKVIGIPSSEYPTAARRPLNSRLDPSKLGVVFGIVPNDWHEGLDDLVAATVENAKLM